MPDFTIPDLNIAEWEEYVRLYGNNINSMYTFGYNKGFNHGYTTSLINDNVNDNNMMPLLTMDDLHNSPTSVNEFGYYSNGGTKSRIKKKRNKKNNKKTNKKTRRCKIKKLEDLK